MAPYSYSSFDGSYTTSPGGGKSNNQEEVIFSLTARLREHDAEIRRLRHENSKLEACRGLDVAYEQLLAQSKKREGRKRELEKENRKLKDKLQVSRKLLDEQEKKSLSIIDNERLLDHNGQLEDDLDMLQQRLHDAMIDNKEKDRQIAIFEGMVDDLTMEADRAKETEDTDKELIARLGDRLETYRQDREEIERENEELQSRVETQRELLKEKDEELVQLELFRDQREDELVEDLIQMRRRVNDVVEIGRVALEEREEEINLLYRQCGQYEDIIDEAEYITYEQRADLKAKKREIEELSVAIEKVQNTGFLGQLDKMCSSSSIYPNTHRYS